MICFLITAEPRPSPTSRFPNKVAAALFANRTLRFVAQQYLDVQNKTSFVWFKQNMSLPRNDTRFEISSNGLYSNLTIRNILQTDFGVYSVIVRNSVGEYIHNYELKAEGNSHCILILIYIIIYMIFISG